MPAIFFAAPGSHRIPFMLGAGETVRDSFVFYLHQFWRKGIRDRTASSIRRSKNSQIYREIRIRVVAACNRGPICLMAVAG